MSERTYLFPAWIRLWHWLNAVLILVLGITGLSLHFADPKLPLVDFELAVRIHNACGITLAITYLVFLIANAVSGNVRHFFPHGPGLFAALWTQLRWYAWGTFRGDPHPHAPTPDSPFNVLQALTYAGVMYGLLPIALVHYLGAMLLLLFLLTHIYLGTTGHSIGQMFRAMISGWHTH